VKGFLTLSPPQKFETEFKNQVVIKLNMLHLPLGIYFAFKYIKIKINGGNRMSLMEKDVVLTTDEAIEYLKISKPTFLKYIRLGRIKAIKAGKGWRVLQSELYRFLRGEPN
jgi:excisionase family DNA binding protein